MIIGRDDVNKVILNWGRDSYAIQSYPDYTVINLKSMPYIMTARKPVDRTRTYYRPVPMGVSIGHIDITAGTSGYVVYNKNGTKLILSNAHVIHPDPTSDKPPERLQILQPGRYDIEKNNLGNYEDFVVGLYAYHHPISVNKLSTCPIAKIKDKIYNAFRRNTMSMSMLEMLGEYNVIDAGVFTESGASFYDKVLLDDGSLYKPTVIYGLVFAGSEEDSIGVVCKASNIEKLLNVKFDIPVDVPKVGENAFYCGRTTGETYVEIISTNMTLNVNYITGIATFTDCIVFRGECRGGNSGSALIN